MKFSRNSFLKNEMKKHLFLLNSTGKSNILILFKPNKIGLFKHQRKFISNKHNSNQSANDFLDEILQIKKTKPSNFSNRKSPLIDQDLNNFDKTIKNDPKINQHINDLNENQKQTTKEKDYLFKNNNKSNENIENDSDFLYGYDSQSTNKNFDNANRNLHDNSNPNLNQNYNAKYNENNTENDKVKKPLTLNFYRDDLIMNLSFKNVLS